MKTNELDRHIKKQKKLLIEKPWFLFNNDIPMQQCNGSEKAKVDKYIIEHFGAMPKHLKWEKRTELKKTIK